LARIKNTRLESKLGGRSRPTFHHPSVARPLRPGGVEREVSFCTSVLAAFNRLIATGYTTATIANCKIGGGLRPFGPQSLKPRCKPQPVRRLTNRLNPLCKRDLQRQSRASAPARRPRKNGQKRPFFRRPNGQIIVRLCNLKTSGSMVYEEVLLRMERHSGDRRPFPRKRRFPPIAEKSH
jgi:hypothetical protein